MAATSSVTVALRIKPSAPEEKSENGCLEVAESVDGQKALVSVRGKAGALSEFTFDTVFVDRNCSNLNQIHSCALLPNTQEVVFKRVARPLCRAVLQGMHASILAYGQTGSGKTYTILGPLDSDRQRNPEHRGLLPRCLSYLFKRLPQPTAGHSDEEQNEQSKHMAQHEEDDDEDEDEQDGEKDRVLSWKMEVQFVEIYQERLFDLLAPPLQQQSSLQPQMLSTGFATGGNGSSNSGNNTVGLAVRYDKHGKGAHVAGAVRREVMCLDDALNAFFTGLRVRRTSETKQNTFSSRSHAIFSVFLTQTKTEPVVGDDTKSIVTAQLHLVDLAGSERQKDTQAVGERLREAGKINSSLSILSQVVRELAEGGGSGGHVPYRDSKLTFLLMNSLGGTGKAAVIATLNQQHQHAAETRSTLAFAALSKSVRLRPVANQTVALSHERVMALVRERAEMAAELKRLEALVSSNGGETSENIEAAPCEEKGSSTDLIQALIDATEAAEAAKMQLRAFLRSTPQAKPEDPKGVRAEDAPAVPNELKVAANQQHTPWNLLQLVLRHSMYSPQLLLQLRKAGFHRETEEGAATFLRVQALLVRLLEVQRQPYLGPHSTSRNIRPVGAAVAAVLASVLEKAVPLLRADTWLSNEQRDVGTTVSRLALSNALSPRGADEKESSCDTCSGVSEAAWRSDHIEDVPASTTEDEKPRAHLDSQIIAAARLLERLTEAALVETIVTEGNLEAAHAAEVRVACDSAIDEALQHLTVLRGFNALSEKLDEGKDSPLVVQEQLATAQHPSVKLGREHSSLEEQTWCNERLHDGFPPILASGTVSCKEAVDDASLSGHFPRDGPEANSPASRSSSVPGGSTRQRLLSLASGLHPDAPMATSVGEANIDSLEERDSAGTLDSKQHFEQLRELLEKERSRSRALEGKLKNLESQLLRCSASSHARESHCTQEGDEEQHLMRLPLAIPLSAICDGRQIDAGQFVFCVHSEAGEPFTPGNPSHRGPCFISMWEEKTGEAGRTASMVIDSVSFALVKKRLPTGASRKVLCLLEKRGHEELHMQLCDAGKAPECEAQTGPLAVATTHEILENTKDKATECGDLRGIACSGSDSID